ncbi:hypothetical protein DM01DRAFT_1369919 [Hesseltinella vesiculosa]|uniref:Uncharacterized protein n=1 Tax=Hesseltinella vesiculosa TaxID=101127 RepID=A0A1X2GVE7_9FUNG|nr:hypothetical protein DM01DRAFT_1369919 [Hesseltinella vesiculosa]
MAGSNLHSVTVCQHCGQMWQRDCNAARIILCVARLVIEGASYPQVLSQKITVQDGGGQGATNDPDPLGNPPPIPSPTTHLILFFSLSYFHDLPPVDTF